MQYEIRDSNGYCKRYWEDPICSPTSRDLTSMYEAGLRLFIDGKKQTLTGALQTVPPNKKK